MDLVYPGTDLVRQNGVLDIGHSGLIKDRDWFVGTANPVQSSGLKNDRHAVVDVKEMSGEAEWVSTAK